MKLTQQGCNTVISVSVSVVCWISEMHFVKSGTLVCKPQRG